MEKNIMICTAVLAVVSPGVLCLCSGSLCLTCLGMVYFSIIWKAVSLTNGGRKMLRKIYRSALEIQDRIS